MPKLQPLSFDDLEGFAEDDHRAAFALFAAHAAAVLNETPVLRPALAAAPALRALFRKALAIPSRDNTTAQLFFEENFLPYRVLPNRILGGDKDHGFLTGYYEPIVEGSLTETKDFRAPVYGRPDDLVTLAAGEMAPGVPSGLSAARRNADGSFSAYPDRTAIEQGALAGHAEVLLYLADPVEVFYAQVQGSARVRLRDGRDVRLICGPQRPSLHIDRPLSRRQRRNRAGRHRTSKASKPGSEPRVRRRENRPRADGAQPFLCVLRAQFRSALVRRTDRRRGLEPRTLAIDRDHSNRLVLWSAVLDFGRSALAGG